MQTHPAKRVEIIIEAPMERRLREVLLKADVTGFTVLPVFGGSGRSGPWSREGQVSRAAGMLAFVCIMRPDKVDDVLEATMQVVERHIGVICVTDCEVMRAERF
ncbi:MAG: transcriptional regulator [Pseudomonadota bacterium]